MGPLEAQIHQAHQARLRRFFPSPRRRPATPVINRAVQVAKPIELPDQIPVQVIEAIANPRTDAPCGPHQKVRLIQKAVSKFYGIQLSDILSHRRPAKVSFARHVAFYLSKRLTTLSLPVIGRHFKKDHTSILYGVNRIEQLRLTSDSVDAEIQAIERGLAL